jgi:hypothetical protein
MSENLYGNCVGEVHNVICMTFHRRLIFLYHCTEIAEFEFKPTANKN